MNFLLKKEKKLIKKFFYLESLEEKYFFLIKIGKLLPLLNKKYLIDKYLINNCQSKIWLKLNHKNNKLIIKAYTEALIPRGLLFLITRIFSNSHTKDVLNYNYYLFIKKIGLNFFLSPLRSNGLLIILNKIKFYVLKNLI
ncbi:MAG: SufE family protein [Candidatus Sulcia muelleri]|uniref:Cysteine desulfurase SufE subunit n=1 Tax=Karelsulcia muelleri (strain GWSS) TaxID=444179 RepID=A8Z5U5_KARMG|nr:cysteine desulfurase SufE subunit [Candidatus Karelsulcia muelleri GWSS]EAT14133.1 cysteine desulfurase SufE subunit [Candidatus Karelsulcia muelleri str. Hc (Homalodisca coagulata)]MBS0018847.1 SufE family protein [Candidatus Karelsulcia muelleri]MCJ7422640.1 SufE family protein [Candidatus Karelsulcia muelleri]MCJ7468739.1 SufE family protein [Candidatus Karelsulcia muelleri]